MIGGKGYEALRESPAVWETVIFGEPGSFITMRNKSIAFPRRIIVSRNSGTISWCVFLCLCFSAAFLDHMGVTFPLDHEKEH